MGHVGPARHAALEIGRRYSAPESINFLNGMLDSIAHSLIPK